MQQNYGPPHTDSQNQRVIPPTLPSNTRGHTITRMLCQVAKTLPILFDRQAETVVKGYALQVLA